MPANMTGMMSMCRRYDRDVVSFLFFPAKKRNRKSSPLGEDPKTQRRRVSKFLCVSESLRLCVFNFLTRFIRGGRIDSMTKDSALKLFSKPLEFERFKIINHLLISPVRDDSSQAGMESVARNACKHDRTNIKVL